MRYRQFVMKLEGKTPEEYESKVALTGDNVLSLVCLHYAGNGLPNLLRNAIVSNPEDALRVFLWGVEVPSIGITHRQDLVYLGRVFTTNDDRSTDQVAEEFGVTP